MLIARALPTSLETLYTVGTSGTVTLKDVTITNTNATPATVTIHLVPAGDSAGTSNALFYAAAVPGNSTVQWVGEQDLAAQDTIQGLATLSGVSVLASGDI